MGIARLCFALDLKNDSALIKEYKAWHTKVWPEVEESFRLTGIQNVSIYHVENRLFMIMEVDSDFSLVKKAAYDSSNDRIQEWEALMDQFQERLPNTPKGQKWRLMEEIYSFE